MSAVEQERLVSFMDNGGSVYMEGANAGFDHNGTDFFDHFGTTFLNTGYQDAISNLNGLADTFTAGTSFNYPTGDPNYNIDQLAADEGVLVLESQDSIGRAVIYDSGTWKTIVSSPLLGCFYESAQFNSRSYLMMEYISFLADIEGPELVTEADNIDFASVFPGEEVAIPLTIHNTGFMELQIWDYELQGEGFSTDMPNSLAIPAQGSAEVNVTFYSENAGNFSGYMELSSNDRDNENVIITFTAECLLPPDIEVSVSSLTVEVTQGEVVTDEFSIINNGQADLTFSITSSSDWLTLNPEEGIITEGNSEVIAFTINSETLLPDVYESALVINCNDPDAVNVLIPVTVEIIPQVDNENDDLPYVTELAGVYPNPFNPQTTFSYNLAETAQVNLQIYNCRGQLVDVLIDQKQRAGKYQIIWEAEHLSSGVYYYHFLAGKEMSRGKVVLIK